MTFWKTVGAVIVAQLIMSFVTLTFYAIVLLAISSKEIL